MGFRYHRITDREENLRSHSPGERATGEFSFPDEDRRFNGVDLPVCPVCRLSPAVDKNRFGSHNLYRIVCPRAFKPHDGWECTRPADTPWLNTRSQAAKVWRMNCLLHNSGQT